MDYQNQFASPSSEYRGKPFWAWNGPLEEDELRRQIRVFKEMGLGGAFMHSRVGLATPYLSEEWFKLIDACADEARKQDMEAWLYDEDRWPSGAAGGLVTKDVRYRMREVTLTVAKPSEYQPTGDEIGVFYAQIDGAGIKNARKADPGVKPEEGESLLAFHVRTMPESRWYNGQTYLDTLSDEAVNEFIRVTHEAYKKNSLSQYNNSVIPGIFTDEPNYGTLGARHFPNTIGCPWTAKLPESFKARYNYDLLDHLPELFFQPEGVAYSAVRHDYIDTLTHLFATNFGGLIGKWCEETGIMFTGHVLAEENLISQTSVVGSAMRFYEYMQAPGIDILCAEGVTREGGSNPEYSTAKQCASVHHQFGRKWMLSELYGCTGWGFTFAEHKAVGDWQAALGVNLRCQHLAWYTMLGEAKRDYPASISFQSPWWRSYSIVEDYFARVGVLMTQGEPVRDVAVIHPVESVWGVVTPGVGLGGASDGNRKAREINEQFMMVQNTLLQEHFDFDYVEEDILSRHGDISGKQLKVGGALYKTVVVPPTITLRKSTVDMLNRFQSAGGSVIFVEPVPTLIQCEASAELNGLIGKSKVIPLDRASLSAALNAVPDLDRVSIATEDGEQHPDTIYMLRKDESGRKFLFIVHTKQDCSTGPLVITLKGNGQVQEWDALTGEVHLADAKSESGTVTIFAELPGVGSALYVIDPEPDSSLRPRKKRKEIQRIIIHQENWPILRNEPNAFPLDVAEFAVNEGEWHAPMEILRIDRAVRDAAGLPHRSGDMVQPWAQTKPPAAKPITVSLRYRFNVEDLPTGPCYLVMETPDNYFISLNGHTLKADQNEGWWIDNSFVKTLVPSSALQEGENTLVLETEYAYNSNLECLYFTGEFGVRIDQDRMTITKLPVTLKLGDWTTQGLPCYTGAVSYVTHFQPSLKEGERLCIEVPNWNGTLLHIRVNGLEAGNIAWPNYELDITDALNPGQNRVEIEVVSGRRNLLGPSHCSILYPRWTGPGQFVTQGEEWTDKYMLLPYGLNEAPVLSILKDA